MVYDEGTAFMPPGTAERLAETIFRGPGAAGRSKRGGQRANSDRCVNRALIDFSRENKGYYRLVVDLI